MREPRSSYGCERGSVSDGAFHGAAQCPLCSVRARITRPTEPPVDADQRTRGFLALSYDEEDLNMQWRNSAQGYGAVPQMLHWITVVLVLLAWSLGQFDDVFPKGAARAASLFVHITAGLAVVGILLLRLLWRIADPPPP